MLKDNNVEVRDFVPSLMPFGHKQREIAFKSAIRHNSNSHKLTFVTGPPNLL